MTFATATTTRTRAPRAPRTRAAALETVSGAVVTREGNVWSIAFDGLDAMINYAETAPATGYVGTRSSRGESHGSWSGGAFADAVRMAREGWADGREQIERYLVSVESIAGQATRTDFESAVYGPIFDIGAFLQDDPYCFLRPVETDDATRSHGPIVRIVMNVTASGSVGHETIMRRGATVAAVVSALETAGRRVEVIATLAARMGTRAVHASVTVKRPDQNVNLDVLAFALAHPAMLRRLMFSIMETAPASVRTGWIKPHGGYGMVAAHPLDATGDVTIGGADSRSNAWTSDENAAREVTRVLAAQGITLTV